MAAPEAPAAPSRERNHGLWIFLIWIVLAAVADLVIWYIWYPHLPPGDMTSSARHQQFDIAVLSITGAPVLLLVLVYFGYALTVWRRRPGDDSDGPPIHGTAKVQATWVISTTIVVLWLFAFGTWELIVPAGAGAGEGPKPIWRLNAAQTTAWTPNSNDMLQVQVIGQQWRFTYRYPQYGGMETTKLELPANTNVEFHVTSLDVIHSFWAYQLGVKADANPGVDDVAYTKTGSLGGKKQLSFTVRCNELCGIWHGAMFDYGTVVSQSAFQQWANSTQTKLASVTSILPPYSPTYDPTTIKQLGKDIVKVAGITGANGYYYPGPQAGNNRGDPVSP